MTVVDRKEGAEVSLGTLVLPSSFVVLLTTCSWPIFHRPSDLFYLYLHFSRSKINYIDPRVTVAWAKKHDVPVEKLLSKVLIEKFQVSSRPYPSFATFRPPPPFFSAADMALCIVCTWHSGLYRPRATGRSRCARAEVARRDEEGEGAPEGQHHLFVFAFLAWVWRH